MLQRKYTRQVSSVFVPLNVIYWLGAAAALRGTLLRAQPQRARSVKIVCNLCGFCVLPVRAALKKDSFSSGFARAIAQPPDIPMRASLVLKRVLTFVGNREKPPQFSHHSLAVLELRPDQRIPNERPYHTTSDNIGVGRPGCPGGTVFAGCGEALSAGSGHCSRR